MRILAATLLSLSIVAGPASGQQTTTEGVKTMPTTEDIRAVAPALEKYAKGVVLDDLWKRPGLSARDRSIVTVAALASLVNIFELPPEQLKRDLVAARAINWENDPFARGAYSYAIVETRQAQGLLANPCGRIPHLRRSAQRRKGHGNSRSGAGRRSGDGVHDCGWNADIARRIHKPTS